MGAVQEAAKVVRLAIEVAGREEIDAVVAPAEAAGELGDRHHLDDRDAEPGQLRQLPAGGLPGPLRGEGPHVHLVEDLPIAPQSPPSFVGPRKSGRIDHLRRAVGPLGLKPGSRIGKGVAAVEPVLVETPPADAGEVTVALGFQLEGARVGCDLDLVSLGSPDPEVNPFGRHLGAKGQPAKRKIRARHAGGRMHTMCRWRTEKELPLPRGTMLVFIP
jgi:hypothetical protein